ncbi:MAG: hypothetical protein JST21_01705 [Bacteroidetes bacterium]|nr:hypothetical protein [Bacteroidota bacterium]MBS1744864.1 hypothetical protein [Bacteroidota bacterium]
MKYLLTIIGGIILMAVAIFIVVMMGMYYDEESPQFITAIVGTVVLILLLVLFANKILKAEAKLNTIANGLPAIATVIQSYQSGQALLSGRVATHYQLIIEVNITNSQGETWQATMREMLPVTQVGIFQPVVSFNVLYDPNDKSKVVFDQAKY